MVVVRLHIVEVLGGGGGGGVPGQGGVILLLEVGRGGALAKLEDRQRENSCMYIQLISNRDYT